MDSELPVGLVFVFSVLLIGIALSALILSGISGSPNGTEETNTSSAQNISHEEASGIVQERLENRTLEGAKNETPSRNGDHPPETVPEDVEPWFSYEDRLYTSEQNNVEFPPPPTAGVYVSDVDNNGYPDILVIDSETAILFENEGSNLTPRTIVTETRVSTEPSGFTGSEIRLSGALFFDHDNDGWDDLLLLPKYDDEEGKPVFLENQEGVFTEKEVGLEVETEAARGASAADYTGNGCLDVFIVQDGDWDENPLTDGDTAGAIQIFNETGFQNLLFRGDCSSFDESTSQLGLYESWSTTSSFADLTNDGYPDIHVTNLLSNDLVYINRGDGSFSPIQLGGFSRVAGMSSALSDITRDGYLDTYVSNINPAEEIPPELEDIEEVEGSYLLTGSGEGEFTDSSGEYGMDTHSWGWGTGVGDISNSGTVELVHGPTDTEHHPTVWRSSQGYDARYLPDRTGKWGYGVALLDMNRDGSLDMVSSTESGEFLYGQNVREDGNYLQVEVEGDGNHTTVGTRVYVEAGGEEQMRVKTSRTDYMSQSSRVLHFGLGDDERVNSLTVNWSDGTEQVFNDIPANQTITVTREGVR